MRRIRTGISALVMAFSLLPSASAQDEQKSYGYVRTLEGSAVLVSADTGATNEAELNYPILTGDLLQVDSNSRIELVLPDFNIIRLDADSIVTFDQLAFSADGDDRVTSIRLERGVLQIVVTEYALGDELPSIVLPNTTVFLHDPGTYRIGTWADESRVTVRSGYAEASTERGSAIARADEEIEISGLGWPSVAVLRAAAPDQLERWGDSLMAELDSGLQGPVDPALAYSANTLADEGEWIEVEGESAWRPRVEQSWRPYTRGNWVSTPSGLNWVGYEPWGWVTHHYGWWSWHTGYGWLWYPGVAYAPAWVTWYWGPTWTGWVPVGYYRSSWGIGFGFSFGFHGWAGGHWGLYSRWTFCPTAYIGVPYGYDHYRGGYEMAGRTGRTAVPRGAILTDTRGLARIDFRDGAKVQEVLAAESRNAGRSRNADITPSTAREGRDADGFRYAVSGSAGWTNTPRDLSERLASRKAARREVGSSARGFRSYVTSTDRTNPLGRPSTVAEGAGAVTIGGRSVTSTGRASGPSTGSRLSTVGEQGWRSRGSSRRVYSFERPEVIERRQGSAYSTGASERVRDAWKVSGVGRSQSNGYRGIGSSSVYGRGPGSRVYGSTYGSRTSTGSRSSSPVRRVIEGITSMGRGPTSSGRTQVGSSRGSGSRGTTIGRGSTSSSRSSSARSSSSRSGSGRSSSARSSSSRSSGSKSSGRSSRSSGSGSRTRSKSNG